MADGSSTVDPERSGFLARGKGIGRHAPLLICLLAVAFLAVRINKGVYLGDEGLTCMAAWRINQGQAANGDFFQLEPPLCLYTLAAVMKVTGPNLLASRVLGLLFGLSLIGLCRSLVVQAVSHPIPQALALAVLIPFGVGAWPFSSPHWLADLLLLAALWCLMKSGPAVSGPWAGLAAAATVGGGLCLQDQGLYAVVALSAAPVFFVRRDRRRAFFARWFGGLAIAALAGLAWVTSLASWGQLWQDWVLFPLTQYRGGQTATLGAVMGWRETLGGLTWSRWLGSPLFLSLMLLSYGLLTALPVLALAAAVAAWLARRAEPYKLALWVALSAAFYGAAAHRWVLMTLIWAAPPGALLLAVGLDAFWDSERAALRGMVRAACWVGLAVLTSFGVVGMAQQLAAPSYAIIAANGTLHTFDRAQGEAIQGFVDAIEQRVPPGAPAFTWGYIPLISFLTAHPNPTRYNLMVSSPPYNSRAQIEEWIGSIERDRVEWGFSHAFPLEPDDPAAAFIRLKYRAVWSNGAFTLWRHE